MSRPARLHQESVPFSMLTNESLYVGVDIGKHRHVAGFVSNTLLTRHERFEACPVLTFEQSREGFRSLVDRICNYVPLVQCFVLLEQTGHYHKALVQYLLELGVSVYVIHVQKRPSYMVKTDKRDALSLANHLYNQLEKGIQLAEKKQLVRQAHPPSQTASLLRGVIRHRYELVQESTQRKNKLTALCDELFPEFSQICKLPNLPSALSLREHFPTPQDMGGTSLTQLQQARVGPYPPDAKLLALQRLAGQSIGTKDSWRRQGLVLEQSQLIKELRLLQEHIEQLDAVIHQTLETSREGKILSSIIGIGSIQAASIIAHIGHIDNFESAAALKSYFGWAPRRTQTGVTSDSTHLAHAGNHVMKQTIYLVVCNAVRMDSEWKQIYERLVPRKCIYDEGTRSYRGKLRVIGHIAGQMIEMIYALLKTDQEVLVNLSPGVEPPPPMLYDPEVHHAHRQGKYHSLKPQVSKEPSLVHIPPLA
jgi:transposase